MLRFRRLSNTSLYVGEHSGAPPSGPDHGQLLFILPSGTPIPSSTLTLDEAWNFQHPSLGAGYFLFVEAGQPLDVNNTDQVRPYHNRLQSLLPRIVRDQAASLGWVNGNPADPESVQLQVLNFVRVGSGMTARVQTPSIPQVIRFKQVEVMILPATPFERMPGEAGFVLNNTAYMAPPGGDPYAEQPTRRRIYMRGAAAYNVDKVGDTVTFPLSGSGRGSVQFDLNDLANSDVDPGVMDIALYYMVPEPTRNRDQSMRYPLLNLANPTGPAGPSSTFSLHARLYPQDHWHSIFEFAEGPVLQSYFQTYHGYPIHLSPQSGAGLTFNTIPNPGVYPSRAVEQETFYGLTMVGGFEMLLDDPTMGGEEYGRMIGGQSGTEYVSFIPRQNGTPGDVLTFFRDKPGYGPEFGGNPTIEPGGSLLSTQFLTSWLNVGTQNGHNPQYFAQPDDAALHGERLPDNVYLEFVEIPTANLPEPGQEDCFPLVPLAGVVAPDDRVSAPLGADQYLIFEQTILNPTRKSTITGIMRETRATLQGRSLLQTPPTRYTTTPQGMLVTVVDGTNWQQLTMAKDDGDAGEVSPRYLRLGDITDEFQDALSSNRLFMVATREPDLVEAGAAVEDLLKVQGWPFQFEIGDPPNGLEQPTSPAHKYNNVLIFKFADRTFDEFAADTRLWARAGDFNGDPSDVQTWLQAFIDNVRDRVENAADDEELERYKPLLTILDNPNWNGILGINVTVPPSELPCEVQPLLGGIRNLNEFKAHHVGFEIAKVQPAADDIERSSIFGLIDYADDSAISEGLQRDDYEFIVQTLQVRFANSEIASFNSKIRLVMTRMFDEDTTLVSGSYNYVDLVGSYQNVNGDPKYTFATPHLAPFKTMGITSSIGGISLFESVTITKAELKSGSCVVAGNPNTEVTSAFHFDGYITFRNSFAFDFFSFDKLVYAGLQLRMSFTMTGDPLLPPTPPANTFEFFPGDLRLDVSLSRSRKDSLLSNFPLRLNGFHWNQGGIDVGKMGYFEISGLIPGWSGANNPQYGLSFTLDLGPLSSIMKKGGPKGAIQIIAAWAPTTADDPGDVTFGVTLGKGSNGKKELGIEGVFVISLSQFGFHKFEDGDHTIYAFFLSNAYLEILGVQIPPGGNFSLVLFVPYNGESERVNLANLGWFLSYQEGPGAGGSAAGSVSVSITPGRDGNISRKDSFPFTVGVTNTFGLIVKAVVRTEIIAVGGGSFGTTAGRPVPPTPQTATKTIPAGGQASFDFTWTANLVGRYQVRATVSTAGGSQSASGSATSTFVIDVNQATDDPKQAKQKKTSVIDVKYLGIGNRVQVPLTTGELRAITSVDKMIAAMGTKMTIVGTPAQLQRQLEQIYTPEGGILIGFDITIMEVFRLAVVFAQENKIYGALIGFTTKAPAFIRGFQFQILYKPVNDEIGVFHILLQLPDFLRRWDIGNGVLTLPIIGIDIYTNGNFKLDLGFPYNFDFSRSLSFEFIIWVLGIPIPLVASLGLYFSYLTGATSTLVPVLTAVSGRPEDEQPMFDPVFEAGFGIRFGLGREMNYGILKAGATITLNAILEGAMAWYWANGRTSSTGAPDMTRFPDWFRVSGQAAIIGRLYGSVDFKIVKASVNIELKAIFTFVFETYKDILFGFRVEVNVSASITIAFVEISFSFSMTIGFEFAIPNPMGDPPWVDHLQSGSAAISRRLMQLPSQGPIEWNATLPVFDTTQPQLDLMFTTAFTSGRNGTDAQAHAVPILSIRREPGAGNALSMVHAFTAWALFSHLGIDNANYGAVLDIEDLEALDARLNAQPVPGGVLAAPDQLIPYATIRDFLVNTFGGVTISMAPTAATTPAVLFPMIPDMSMDVAHVSSDPDGPDGSVILAPRSFADFNVRGRDYHLDLVNYFGLLEADVLDKSDLGFTRDLLQNDYEASSLAQTMFEDYFEMLLKGGVAQIMEWAKVNLTSGTTTIGELMDIMSANGTLAAGSPFDTVLAMNSRYFAHGLRMPENFPANYDPVALTEDALGLYQLTGQQYPVNLPSDAALIWQLRLTVNSGVTWVSAPAELAYQVNTQMERDRIDAYNNTATMAEIYNGLEPTVVPSVRSQNKQFAFKPGARYERPAGATTGFIYPMSDVLLERLAETPSPSLSAHNLHDGGTDSNLPAWNWALRIPFSARQVRKTVTTVTDTGDGATRASDDEVIPNTYEIGGTDEATRAIIGQFIDGSAGNGVVASVELNYHLHGHDDAFFGETGVTAGLMKTNLSTVSLPQDISLQQIPADGGYSAELIPDQAQQSLRLLWEASIVNSSGYYLYYDNGNADPAQSGIPEDAFQGAENRAYLTLVVRFTQSTAGVNALDVRDANFEPGSLYAELAGELAWLPTLAPGSVAFELRREPTQTMGTAAQELANLFTLLSYRIEDSTDFNASIHGLPVGPLVDDESPDDVWVYRQGIKVFPYVVGGGTPARRYDAVGKTVNLGFEFLDVFGNRLPEGVTGNPTLPVPVLYSDPLISVGTWPGIGLHYDFASGTLTVNLRFDAGSYFSGALPSYPVDADHEAALQQRRDAALDDYRKVLEQLTAPGISIMLHTSVAPDKSGDQRDAILPFIQNIVAFLDNTTNPGSDVIDLSLSMPITPGDRAAQGNHIFPVQVELAVQRDPSFVDPFASERLPEVQRSATRVSPEATTIAVPLPGNPDDPEWGDPDNPAWGDTRQQTAYEVFAREFEDAFPEFKVATGLGENGPHTIWAIRMGDSGLDWTFGAAPSFFSPAPLSRVLLTRNEVPIRTQYWGSTGNPEGPLTYETFNGVDLDIWARDFLEAVDRFLSPELAVTARRVAYEPYGRIIAAKEDIADAIAGGVTWVVNSDPGPVPTEMAQEGYRQQLLAKLSSAYSVETAVIYPVGTTNSNTGTPPRLFGNVFGSRAGGVVDDPKDPDPQSGFIFSPAKVDLSGGQEYLATMFSSGRTESYAAADLEVRYGLTHIEHDIEPENDDGYQASSWLTLVLPDDPQSLGPVDIPIALREYPTAPELAGQTAVAVHPNSATNLTDAKLWNYRYSINQTARPQDTTFSVIDFNVGLDGLTRSLLQTDPDLFLWLARFTREYPEFQGNLDLLGKGARGLEGAELDSAVDAVAWFANIIEGAAATWAQWISDQENLLRNLQQSTALLPYQWTFEIDERLDAGLNRVQIEIEGSSNEPGMFPVEMPLIETYLEDGSLIELAPTAAGNAFNYFYDWHSDALPDFRLQTLVIGDLDVLNTENAWGSIYLKRNLNLTTLGKPERPTNPRFVYETPETRFVNKATPLLDTIVPINIYPDGAPKSLAQHLIDMLTDLFDTADAGSNTIERLLKVGVRYAYDVRGQDGPAEGPLQLDEFIANMPVTQRMPFQIQPNAGGISAFAGDLAEEIERWMGDINPSRARGYYEFDVSVFAALSRTDLPVLRLRRLWVGLDKIS